MSDGSDQGKCPIERGGLFRCCGSPQACEHVVDPDVERRNWPLLVETGKAFRDAKGGELV